MPPPPVPKQAQPAGPGKDFLELTARLRMIEERYSELNQKTEVIEHNMLAKNNKVTTEMKMLKKDIADLRQKITEVEDNMTTVIREIKLLARKEDLTVLKKYLDYWKPVNFVTREYFDKELLKLREEVKKISEKEKELENEKHKIEYIK